MVKRLSDVPEVEAMHLRRIECPTYDDTPALPGKPLDERRVAIISTAGLHKRGDRPFRPGDGSYRIIPAETPANALVMSHISVNFDRKGRIVAICQDPSVGPTLYMFDPTTLEQLGKFDLPPRQEQGHDPWPPVGRVPGKPLQE